jgi:NADPH-dependent curcumin reductase CurA
MEQVETTDIADHIDMNTSIHLAKRPKDRIIPGETFEVRRTPIPKKDAVKEGQALLKVEYLSVDPGMHD